MKKYLRLPDGSIFQKRPAGATLYLKSETEQWGKKRRLSVNMDGAKLLELCNGKLPREELVKKHNSLYPGNIVAGDTADKFFAKTLEAGMVEASAEPVRSTSRVCGSHEHYYPQHNTIEVTSQCNYKCKHCYRESSPSENLHLDHEKLMKYLDEFRDHGGSVIEITGGEPMLYRNFFELVDWSWRNLEVVGVLTNGYYLQEEAIERLLPFREKLVFNISLDSHRPQFHNAFRGKEDAFEKTTRAMELLGRNKFRFRLSMSVTRDNFFDMEGTAELAKKYGAAYFGCNMVQDLGRGGELVSGMTEAFRKDPERHAAYEQMIHEKYKGFLHIVSEEGKKQLETGNCGIVHTTVTVGPDGEMRPCAMFDSGLRIGNIYKQSFEEIFHSTLGAAFNAMHAPKKELCGDCKMLGICNGCILRGIKTGLAQPDCKWLKSVDILKYISLPPEEKKCGNLSEPNYG
ncbi:MAG: hypothetical protein COT18_02410 [Elusimicrobia bacterium CG08_land_8_20_14_0_20_59_10]|nr:MAG: hypothetical protein COT18_02410 [Elusimicrobia bacterium CG08_land_8_20_14_0_20_59_10]